MPSAQRLRDEPEPGPATSPSRRRPLPRGSGSTGAYLTAGITLTRVGGATWVTEVRKGGLINRRAEGCGKGKRKRKKDRGEEIASRSRLPPVNIIYLSSIQDDCLRHRLSTLARLIVG